ncbi:hypothetical protein [Candidatus Lokiarchaeum ossiferum]|uniref:hypothetical protein n=1 Tax=Candidatus Lokiarchaeum ossiferum TaxID=2951803 RepID=UPI00352DE9D7
MAPQKNTQINSIEDIPESQISMSEQKTSPKNSIDHWVAQIIQIVGQISASFPIFTQVDTSNKPKNVSYSQAESHINHLILLLKASIFQTNSSLNKITDFGEEDLPKIISSVSKLNELQESFQEIKKNMVEVLDLIDVSQFSYCSSCQTLEKSIDFSLCDQCHSVLIKGQEIRDFLIHNYFSKEIPYPMEIIQSLHQKFKGQVKELSFEVQGLEKKRQLVEVPLELNLNPSATYSFFVIDDTHELVPMTTSIMENESNVQNQKADHEICRECGTKMRFLRSTMYYETSADLFQCPKCSMEKMMNFKPIWESNIQDSD